MNVGRITAALVAIALATTTIATSATARVRRQSGGTPTTTTTLARDDCESVGDVVASYRPTGPIPAPGQMPVDSTMSKILGTREVGGNTITRKLVVGVDENTLFFSARDPLTGDVSGFEVALARKIAEALTGDPEAIKLVTVISKEKLPSVKENKVDMTISVVTMDCDRWNQSAAFSTAYYQAFQQMMVPEGSPIRKQSDLPGKRVCVTDPSSSLEFLKSNVPSAIRVPVSTRTACLVKLQENKVDAVVLPSSILAGLHAQDPTTTLLPDQLVGKGSANTYGVAINHNNLDLVRYVNALLEQWRGDGTLAGLQDDHFPQDLPIHVPKSTYRTQP